MLKVLSTITKLGAAYVVLQILTGIEVGIIAAGLALSGMSLPAALAATVIPVGMPLLIIQGVILYGVSSSLTSLVFPGAVNAPTHASTGDEFVKPYRLPAVGTVVAKTG